jgi:NAD-dependent deacetylase
LLPDALIEALRGAQHVCVLTGAGVSAESGIPTFREAQTGLWENYDPMDLATPEAFLRDPALVWRWYRWRRDLVADAEPNPGHIALAELEQRVPSPSRRGQGLVSWHHVRSRDLYTLTRDNLTDYPRINSRRSSSVANFVNVVSGCNGYHTNAHVEHAKHLVFLYLASLLE